MNISIDHLNINVMSLGMSLKYDADCLFISILSIIFV